MGGLLLLLFGVDSEHSMQQGLFEHESDAFTVFVTIVEQLATQ